MRDNVEFVEQFGSRFFRRRGTEIVWSDGWHGEEHSVDPKKEIGHVVGLPRSQIISVFFVDGTAVSLSPAEDSRPFNPDEYKAVWERTMADLRSVADGSAMGLS